MICHEAMLTEHFPFFWLSGARFCYGSVVGTAQLRRAEAHLALIHLP